MRIQSSSSLPSPGQSPNTDRRSDLPGRRIVELVAGLEEHRLLGRRQAVEAAGAGDELAGRDRAAERRELEADVQARQALERAGERRARGDHALDRHRRIDREHRAHQQAAVRQAEQVDVVLADLGQAPDLADQRGRDVDRAQPPVVGEHVQVLAGHVAGASQRLLERAQDVVAQPGEERDRAHDLARLSGQPGARRQARPTVEAAERPPDGAQLFVVELGTEQSGDDHQVPHVRI